MKGLENRKCMYGRDIVGLGESECLRAFVAHKIVWRALQANPFKEHVRQFMRPSSLHCN